MELPAQVDTKQRRVADGPGPAFWVGRLTSISGTAVTQVVLPVFMIVVLGYGPEAVAAVAIAGILPNLLGPLYVGFVAEQLRPRTCLVLADALRAGCLAAVAVLSLADALTLPALAVLNLVIGIGNAIFGAVLFASVELLVGRQGLPRANGKLQLFHTVGETAGAAGGGYAFQALGGPIVFVVDALTYCVSALTVLVTKPLADARPVGEWERTGRITFSAIVARGARFVWDSHAFRVLVATGAGFNLLAGGSLAVLVVYLVRDLGFTAVQYSIVMACGALGGALGAVSVAPLVRRMPLRTAMAAALLVYGIAQICYPLLHSASIGTVVLACVVDLFIGIAMSVYVVNSATLYQVLVPRSLLAPVSSFARAVGQSALPLGLAACGLAAAVIGTRPVLVVVGAGQIAIALLFTLNRRALPQSLEP